MHALRPVILSGGSGTRLWPLSTPDLPKQFAPLLDEGTLFVMTADRLAGLEELRPAIVATGSAHLALVESAAASSDVEIGRILVEPVGRNTAPAMIAAALVADADDVLVVLPSDHLIADADGFREAVRQAGGLAEGGAVVTFGVAPTRPDTGYGYIEMGERHGAAHRVEAFREKPSLSDAEEMVADGRHLWNSGMFVARAEVVLAEASAHCPGLLEGVRHALPMDQGRVVRLGDSFASVEAISFDNAIMEKTSNALVLPVDLGWDDVGSYRSLLAAGDTDENGNHVAGDVTLSDVSGSFVKATSRRVVVAGLSGVVVVETPDAVLVVPLDRAQDVRDLQRREGDG